MKRATILLLAAFLLLLPAGCAKQAPPEPGSEEESYQAVNINEIQNHYEDTAILVSKDTDEKSLTFQNIETGLRYTLDYDGTTFFVDRAGNPLTDSQLVTGSIADITFMKSPKKLEAFAISDDYFIYNKVDSFEITNKETRLVYLKDRYVLDDYLVIADRNDYLEVSELQEGDVVTLYGKGHTIYSISLETGHGYVRLSNDNYFVGGFIEVGKVIRKITENMILTVPEGKYEMLVSNDGIIGNKSITVGRNQEVTVDLGDINTEKKYGNILFVMSPEDSVLYVDGLKADTSAPVKMEYGIHQLIAMAKGYSTLSEYINVGSPSASVSITLQKSDSESSSEKSSEKNSEKNSDKNSESASNKNSESTSDQNSEKNSENRSDKGSEPVSSGENPSEWTSEDPSYYTSEKNSENSSEGSSQSASTTAKVHIDAPEGAEIYVNGNYVGLAPTSFPKEAGKCEIIVRKNGFKPRSYTISIDDEKQDVHFSFSALQPITD